MSVNAIRFVKEPWSAHTQVIGPIEISKASWERSGRSPMYRGCDRCRSPYKIVRVHGKKDEPIIHQEEEKRELDM